MGPWHLRLEKILPLLTSFILSISGFTKYSVIIRKYAADFANVLRFGLRARVAIIFSYIISTSKKASAFLFVKFFLGCESC